MFKTAGEKTFLKQGLIVIGVMVGLYFFVLGPFLKAGNSILDEELERKGTEIKRYISRTGSLPSRADFDKMEKETLMLQDRLKKLSNFVDPKKVRIPDSSSEAGLYFIEKLHSSMKDFSNKAASKGIKLPESLGFGDGLPKEDMVETLLRQLETVKETVDILLESDKIEFFAIKPLRSIDYTGSSAKEVFYTELPVQISIRTDTKTLVNLLVELKNKTPIVSVKELHVKSGGSETDGIEVSMVLSTFIVSETSAYGTK